MDYLDKTAFVSSRDVAGEYEVSFPCTITAHYHLSTSILNVHLSTIWIDSEPTK